MLCTDTLSRVFNPSVNYRACSSFGAQGLPYIDIFHVLCEGHCSFTFSKDPPVIKIDQTPELKRGVSGLLNW